MPLHLFKWTHSLQLQHSSFCDGLALQAFEMEPFEQWVHCVAVTPILVCSRPEQNLESHSQRLRASEQESEVSKSQQMEIVDLRQKRPPAEKGPAKDKKAAPKQREDAQGRGSNLESDST